MPNTASSTSGGYEFVSAWNTLAELFASDPGRAARYVVVAGDLRIDYSKQPVDDAMMAGLLEAA
mgnify:CR=1 FL=1